MAETKDDAERERMRPFVTELRKWWSFDNGQQHTHSWHEREDFIEKVLPGLLRAEFSRGVEAAARACEKSYLLDDAVTTPDGVKARRQAAEQIRKFHLATADQGLPREGKARGAEPRP